MLAARQRAGLAARQLRRPARTYASDAHGHANKHAEAEANESFGKGSIITLSAFFGGVLLYQVAPRKGDQSALTSWLGKHLSTSEDWADINAAHVKAAEQAGYDRNLFENEGSKHRFVDVSFPEALQSHAPRNIQAGQLNNIDHVVEHYRQKAAKENERKASKLAQREQ